MDSLTVDHVRAGPVNLTILAAYCREPSQLTRLGGVDHVRSRPINLAVLSGYCCEPSQRARLGRIRMRLIEPRAPIFHDPQALGCSRGIAGDNHSAPLLRVSRPVPAKDEAVLRL
jgi:hypothetical protein